MVGIRKAARVAARLSSFVGVWLLSSLSSFVLLPVLARQVSVGEWTAVAVGQSIGSIAGLATSFGWNAAGPPRVARADEAERLREYAQSLAVRGVIFAVTLPLTLLSSVALAPEHAILSWVMALAWTINGLTPIWFNVGEGRARDAVVYDIVPKGIATVLAAGLIIWSGASIWYPLTLIVATTIGTTLFSLRRFPTGLLRAAFDTDVISTLQRNASPAVSDFVSGAFNASVVVLATPTTPTAELARYAAADKAYRMGSQIITSVSNAFQGWVAEHEGLRGRRRRSAALATHVVFGVLGAILFAILGPWATQILYGADLRASRETMIYLGAALGLLCASTSLIRHVLIPTGRTKAVLRSSAVGLAAAALSIPTLSKADGANGIAAAVAITQLVTLVALAVGTFRRGL